MQTRVIDIVDLMELKDWVFIYTQSNTYLYNGLVAFVTHEILRQPVKSIEVYSDGGSKGLKIIIE